MYRNQTIFKEVFVIDLYSSSVEDLETLVYFFNFHEMSDMPRNTQYPVTDLHVVQHPPQSESQNAFKVRLFFDEKNNPCPGVPLI